MLTRLLVCSVVGAGVVLPAAVAFGAAGQLSPTATGVVSIQGTRAAWSERVGTGPERRYRLVTQLGTQPAVAIPGVRSRRVPFDADLGLDAHGGQVILYSRCRNEFPFQRTETNEEGWDLGTGCRIYEYSFSTGRERVIRATGSGSAFFPSRSGTHIAFGERRGYEVRLRLLDVASGRVRDFRGGAPLPDGRGDDLEFSGPGPVNVDLQGTTAVFQWVYYPRSCPADDGRPDTLATEIWTQTIGQAGTRAARGCTSSSTLPYTVRAPTRISSGIAYTKVDPNFQNQLICRTAKGETASGPAPPWRSLASGTERSLGIAANGLATIGLDALAPNLGCP